MLSKLLVFFTETYFELLSGGSLHTPQSLMSRPRSWQSNGHSNSGRNKIVDWAPQNILIVNCWSLYTNGRVATVKMVMISSLGVRMLDRLHHYYWHPTSNQNFMMFSHNHQPIPGLYHYPHQFPGGCWIFGVERNISNSGTIFLCSRHQRTSDPVVCPHVTPELGLATIQSWHH